MVKALHRLWNNLALLGRAQRSLIKGIIYLFILLFVLFPNPALVIDQVGAYLNTEALFETGFPEMAGINAQIDSLLPDDYNFQQEAKVITRFVYDKIAYEFDWDNWANCEYWPSASRVWRRGREDCDGQAILAVAIFRSRGYRDADIIGSMQHLWIQVNGKEMMGPDKEKLVVVKDGKKQFHTPGWRYMLETTAVQLNYFPKFRIVILLLALLTLLYHPAQSWKRLLILHIVAMLGFFLLLDWAHKVEFYRHLTFSAGFFTGSLLILASLVVAILSDGTKHPRNAATAL